MIDRERKHLQTFVSKYKDPTTAARAWGISPQTLRDILNGQRGIGRDIYFRLLEAIPDIDAVKLANIRKTKP